MQRRGTFQYHVLDTILLREREKKKDGRMVYEDLRGEGKDTLLRGLDVNVTVHVSKLTLPQNHSHFMYFVVVQHKSA